MSTYGDNMDYTGEFEFNIDDIIREFKYEGSEQQLQDIISEVRGTVSNVEADVSGIIPESATEDEVFSPRSRSAGKKKKKDVQKGVKKNVKKAKKEVQNDITESVEPVEEVTADISGLIPESEIEDESFPTNPSKKRNDRRSKRKDSRKDSKKDVQKVEQKEPEEPVKPSNTYEEPVEPKIAHSVEEDLSLEAIIASIKY